MILVASSEIIWCGKPVPRPFALLAVGSFVEDAAVSFGRTCPCSTRMFTRPVAHLS